MVGIGITGAIASGKTTVAKLIARKKYPLFSADKVVSDLYSKDNFKKLLLKKFKLNRKKKIKNQIKSIIQKNKKKLRILELVIHPIVRKEMISFLKKKDKVLVLEIPLLTENKLYKFFDKVIFVDAKKKLRLKRYLSNKNERIIFEILNKRQLSSAVKKKKCDLVIDNNYSLAILKKNVKNFIRFYE